ncbi:helix-turn-helix domain-containing protein [Pseudarthrobacter sp. LMD1-1-1.1]|uniref:helix-turn-helix domain-containing protein n=1 Tax=Pseudarthrobacter sp. LMD1-1-1.1 TaxID=3135242 RepID=UPI00341DC5CB
MDSEGKQGHPRLLTIAEVASVTRLSTATVYRLVQANRIHAFRFGRSYRVPEIAVDQYIAHSSISENTHRSSTRRFDER